MQENRGGAIEENITSSIDIDKHQIILSAKKSIIDIILLLFLFINKIASSRVYFDMLFSFCVLDEIKIKNYN